MNTLLTKTAPGSALPTMPEDLLDFLITRVPLIDPRTTWGTGGAYLTGLPTGPPLLPPGRAGSLAFALGEWIQAQGKFPEQYAFDGAALLSERAWYTGHSRQGSTTLGGGGKLLTLQDGSLAAVSCARIDDPLLYGAALGMTVPSTDPWPALTLGMSRSTPEEVRQIALELSLPCWTVDQLAPASPIPQQAAGQLRQTRQPRDFSGVRVIDFSSLWAGPLCGHLLGLAGSEVIKVESIQRPDGARFGNKPFYDLLHSGHRAVSFDPTDRSSLDALRDLVSSADIVIEASRPRALRRLGIDAEAHVAAGATWVSITAAGRASSRIGFGDDIAASAGLIARAHDGTPCFVGDAIADPLAGLFAAAACMTVPTVTARTQYDVLNGSVQKSDVRPRGELWDISMYDAVRFALRGTPVTDRPTPDPILTGAVPPAQRVLPPCEAPPTLGADDATFLAIAPATEHLSHD